MKTEKRVDYLTRDSIMRLLSDDEIAAVSTAQTAPHLAEGDEYVDLETLSRGTHGGGGVSATMGHVLPRKAVADATWHKILLALETDRERMVAGVS
jgi:hypothetical protein